jgi:hypothetical protein
MKKGQHKQISWISSYHIPLLIWQRRNRTERIIGTDNCFVVWGDAESRCDMYLSTYFLIYVFIYLPPITFRRFLFVSPL